MRCFYHPDIDSVGICQECGKSACCACIDDVGGRMICKGCLERMQTLQRQQEQAAEAERQAELVSTQQQARKRIRRSYICGGLGLAFFFVMAIMAAGDKTATPPIPWPILIPFAAYVCWSIYWGLAWFWPIWRSGVRRFRQALSGWILIARPFIWFMLLIFYVTFYFSIPLAIAIYYGVFGGGIYQFLKHRRLAATGPIASAV